MKKERHISLLVIPHNRGKHRTISLSKRAVNILMVAAPTLAVGLIVFLIDYFIMTGIRYKYKKLSSESVRLQAEIVQYKKSIDSLETTLEDFEQYRKKLNIIAGLKAEEVLEGEPGIGGASSEQFENLPSSGQDLGHVREITERADGIKTNYVTLLNFFENQKIEFAQTPSIMPTRGYWVSSYGSRVDPFTGKKTFHWGVDIATQYSNPVLATANGIVLQTAVDKIGGKTIKVSHPKTGFVTVYCHLSKFLAKPGDKVNRGDVIGQVGSTGRARGPHVHYEIRKDGKRVNPWYYILDN